VTMELNMLAWRPLRACTPERISTPAMDNADGSTTGSSQVLQYTGKPNMSRPAAMAGNLEGTMKKADTVANARVSWSLETGSAA